MTPGESELSVIQRQTRVLSDTYAALPTTGLRAGDLAYATDRRTLYRWSGAAWVDISIYSDAGTYAAIPTASDLPEGSLYYATDTAILYQVQSTAWFAIVAIGSSPRLPYFASCWQIPGWGGDGNLGFTLTANKIYYFPIVIPRSMTFDRVGTHCSVNQAGSVVECHLFYGNPDGSVGGLVADLGDFDTGTTGSKTITINQTLGPGYYYIALRTTTANVKIWAFGQDGHAPVHGISLSAPSGQPQYTTTSVSSAWADPGPSPTTIETTVLGCAVVFRET